MIYRIDSDRAGDTYRCINCGGVFEVRADDYTQHPEVVDPDDWHVLARRDLVERHDESGECDADEE